MGFAEKILSVLEGMPEEKIAEVIDFAEYLKAKTLSEQKKIVDNFIIKYDEALKELAK